MHTAYHIRLAIPRDIAHLPQIERAAASAFLPIAPALGLTPAMLDDVTQVDDFALGQEAGLLWVAVEERDAPVGFALLRPIDDLIHLEELDVHPDHARRGLGAALVEQVCQWAESAGYKGMTLSTFRDVPWNAPFYAAHGFRVLEPGELTPGLAGVAAAEAAHGLRPQLRVIMRRDFLSAT